MTCFANKQGLDFKQTAAFEVIASSYILQCLDSHGINHERIQHIFGVNSIEGTSKLQKLNNLKGLLLKKRWHDESIHVFIRYGWLWKKQSNQCF